MFGETILDTAAVSLRWDTMIAAGILERIGGAAGCERPRVPTASSHRHRFARHPVTWEAPGHLPSLAPVSK